MNIWSSTIQTAYLGIAGKLCHSQLPLFVSKVPIPSITSQSSNLWKIVRPLVGPMQKSRQYSSMFGKNYASGSVTSVSFVTSIQPKMLLSPTMITTVQPCAGMKMVNNPKRRCKHCYIVIEDERKYVFCDKFPRHKQCTKRLAVTMKYQRVLTHATQGAHSHCGKGRMGMWTQQGLRQDY